MKSATGFTLQVVKRERWERRDPISRAGIAAARVSNSVEYAVDVDADADGVSAKPYQLNHEQTMEAVATGKACGCGGCFCCSVLEAWHNRGTVDV